MSSPPPELGAVVGPDGIRADVLNQSMDGDAITTGLMLGIVSFGAIGGLAGFMADSWLLAAVAIGGAVGLSVLTLRNARRWAVQTRILIDSRGLDIGGHLFKPSEIVSAGVEHTGGGIPTLRLHLRVPDRRLGFPLRTSLRAVTWLAERINELAPETAEEGERLAREEGEGKQQVTTAAAGLKKRGRSAAP